MNSKREIHSNDENNSRELSQLFECLLPPIQMTPRIKPSNVQMNTVAQAVNSTNFLGNFSSSGPPLPCATSLKRDDPSWNQDSGDNNNKLFLFLESDRNQ